MLTLNVADNSLNAAPFVKCKYNSVSHLVGVGIYGKNDTILYKPD